MNLFLRTIALATLSAMICTVSAGAKETLPLTGPSPHFRSARDLGPMAFSSNIKIKNSSATAKTVYGIYVKQLSQVAPGQPCSAATLIYPGSLNTSVGAIAMLNNMGPGTEAEVGPTILYNMIYGASYYVQVTTPVSPPGCSLPGCTWGSDTTLYNWCIQVGALAPVTATAGYAEAVLVPSVEPVNGADYNFNLVNNYQVLGPIACDDQSLTCTVGSPQTQTF